MGMSEDQAQRYRDLFLVCQGRMWSERGIRLVALSDEATFSDIGISDDENCERVCIEPGNWSQLVGIADDLGVDLSVF